jgi:hypothetical protein
MYKSIVSNVTYNLFKYSAIINQDLDHTTDLLKKTIHNIIEKTENLERKDIIQITLEEILKELYTQQHDIFIIYINEQPVSYTFTKKLAHDRLNDFAQRIKYKRFVKYPTSHTYIETVNENEICVMSKFDPLFDRPQKYCTLYIQRVSNIKT